jgi:hypothetical protein
MGGKDLTENLSIGVVVNVENQTAQLVHEPPPRERNCGILHQQE